MATQAERKKINALMKKHKDSCSICHEAFDDDSVTYTVFGYDQKDIMQVTSGCCAATLGEPVVLGVCGYFDPDDFDKIMQKHPMAKRFLSK